MAPSAQSFIGMTRFGNVADLSQYCHQLETGSLPIATCESLGQEQALRESVIFGLRLIDGVPLDVIDQMDDCADWRTTLSGLMEKGLLEFTAQRLRLTNLGRRFADTVAVALW